MAARINVMNTGQQIQNERLADKTLKPLLYICSTVNTVYVIQFKKIELVYADINIRRSILRNII